MGSFRRAGRRRTVRSFGALFQPLFIIVSSITVIIQRRDATNVMSTRANAVVVTTSVSASRTARSVDEKTRARVGG